MFYKLVESVYNKVIFKLLGAAVGVMVLALLVYPITLSPSFVRMLKVPDVPVLGLAIPFISKEKLDPAGIVVVIGKVNSPSVTVQGSFVPLRIHSIDLSKVAKFELNSFEN